MQDINHLLNRVAFGLRPGDIEQVQRVGTDKYLEEQLHPDRIEDHVAEKRLTEIASIRMNPPELMRKYPQPQQLAKKLSMNAADPNGQRRIQEIQQKKSIKDPQQLLQEL